MIEENLIETIDYLKTVSDFKGEKNTQSYTLTSEFDKPNYDTCIDFVHNNTSVLYDKDLPEEFISDSRNNKRKNGTTNTSNFRKLRFFFN